MSYRGAHMLTGSLPEDSHPKYFHTARPGNNYHNRQLFYFSEHERGGGNFPWMLYCNQSNFWKNVHYRSFPVYYTIKKIIKNQLLQNGSKLRHSNSVTSGANKAKETLTARLSGNTVIETKTFVKLEKKSPDENPLKPTGFENPPICPSLCSEIS